MHLLISNIKEEITADGWDECLSPLLRNVSKTAHDYQLGVIQNQRSSNKAAQHNAVII